jgi:hypothetical protein
MQSSVVPYRLLDDTIVADNWPALTNGSLPLHHGIDMDENRASLSQSEVWTGTKPFGIYAGTSCGDWMGGTTQTTGVIGLTGQTTGMWSKATDGPCTLPGGAHIYCFQQ